MINDDEVKLLHEHINWSIAKLVKRAFLPLDADAVVRLFIALCGGDQRWQGAAMIPCDAGELDSLAHAWLRMADVF